MRNNICPTRDCAGKKPKYEQVNVQEKRNEQGVTDSIHCLTTSTSTGSNIHQLWVCHGYSHRKYYKR